MRKLALLLLLVLTTAVTLSGVALAIETPRGPVFTLSRDQMLDDDLFFAGKTVVIDGTVNGDVVLLAESATINGTIKGNLVVAAGRIFVRGTVNGAVIGAAENIVVDGAVRRTLLSAAQTVTVSERATVGGTWAGAADSLTLQGQVERGAALAATRVDITGKIGRDLRAATDDLAFGPNARVGGKITLRGERDPHVAPGAEIGPVARTAPPPKADSRTRPWFASPPMLAVKLVGFLVVGLVLLTLFPDLRTRFPATAQNKPWQALLAGFLALVAVPIAAIIAMVTLVGLPVGLLGLTLYPAAIYLGQVCVSWTAGRLLADRIPVLARQPWPVLLIAGALLTSVLTELPYVGWVFGTAFVLYGLGGLYYLLTDREPAPDIGT